MVEVEQTRCCVLPTCNGKQHKRGYKSSLCFIRGNLLVLGLKFCAKQLVHPLKKKGISNQLVKGTYCMTNNLYPLLCCFLLQVGRARIKIQKIAGLQTHYPYKPKLCFARLARTACLTNLSFCTKQVDQDKIHPQYNLLKT